jgi:NAD(P)-dependent dehydrogenase (short-subunit alcohol dehydrogenase family)
MDSVIVDLSGRTALVTGAGRGIGRAIAEALAAKGATVYLAARTASQLEATADAIRSTGGSAVPVPTDLGNESEIEALFDRIRNETGGPDILVNNAGIGIFGPTVDASPADFDAVMQINAKAAFLCCRLALKSMIAARSSTSRAWSVSRAIPTRGSTQPASTPS